MLYTIVKTLQCYVNKLYIQSPFWVPMWVFLLFSVISVLPIEATDFNISLRKYWSHMTTCYVASVYVSIL